jgi:hypothetical protein
MSGWAWFVLGFASALMVVAFVSAYKQFLEADRE